MADITEAGGRCLSRVGYRRTKMADVAAEAGVSTGSVYTYLEGKEALFHAVLAHRLSVPPGAGLPLRAPAFEETLSMLADGLRRQGATPVLRGAVDAPAPPDVRSELAAIVDEQYGVVSRLWPALSVVEACAADLPPLEEFYFGRRRRRHIDLLVRYLHARAGEGRLLALPDLTVAAQLVHEAVAWFAWKRFEGRDAARFDDELARRTVVEYACNAIAGPRPGSDTSR